MKLTPMGKAILVLLGLVTIYFGIRNFAPDIRKWALGDKADKAQSAKEPVASDDFGALKDAPADPERGKGATGVTAASLQGGGKLARPLVVGINTWAGHAPGIVFNRGLEPSERSLYSKQLGLDVKFVLLEDPAAKLAAFKKGDIDLMWDTVDNWAREASLLGESGVAAKSIILQDWSRGGDGIVALSSIKSVEDLRGKTIACTQFTPSHFLLLFLLSQSGLSGEERAAIEKGLVFTQDAPAAAAMFKARQVDAAVTWEPDLSGAVAARGGEAHVLISTAAATHVIADTLVARQELIDQAPTSLQAFVQGWLQGIELLREDPTSSQLIVGEALKLDAETVSGMLSGLKLTPLRRQRGRSTG